MSRRKLSEVPRPSFCHYHQMLKLEVIFEFRLFLDRDLADRIPLDECSDSFLRAR